MGISFIGHEISVKSVSWYIWETFEKCFHQQTFNIIMINYKQYVLMVIQFKCFKNIQM